MDLIKKLNGYPIIITTAEKQIRRHKKKRINKKWRKRYGMISYDILPDGKVMFYGNMYYMNKTTYEALNKYINNLKDHEDLCCKEVKMILNSIKNKEDK